MRPPLPLQQVSAELGPWPLHDTAASRSVEAAALGHNAPHALMACAGAAAASLASAMAPHARRVTVFAGPGNNGGDGLVAARHLHAAGRQVQVWLLGDVSRQPADAAHALAMAQQAGVTLRQPTAPDWAAEVPGSDCDLVIDAVLGLGSRRAPGGAIAQAIDAIQHLQARPTLAVDIPSGLHPDTGALLGERAVHATATLALLTLKPGCFTGLGRDHAGQMWWHALGADPAAPTAHLLAPGAMPQRLHATHKGSQGDVIVVGGAAGMAGAAWLAARAALASGAGRVYLSPTDDAAGAFDPQRPELMLQRAAWRLPPPRLTAATVVCGCGAGPGLQALLPPLLAHAGRLVLDADALNAVASDPTLRGLLRARGSRGQPTVLTPHPLEAARLLACSTADVQRDRLAAALALAGELSAVVVLKGSGTVVVAPGAMPGINPTGNGALASAGTGDVLAGWIGGLWAQRHPDLPPARVAADAVWLHGAAADLHVAGGSRGPLRAADLIEAMARVPQPG